LKVALGQDPPGSAGEEETPAEGQGSKGPSSEEPSATKPPAKEPNSKKPGSKEPTPRSVPKKSVPKKSPSQEAEPGSKKEPASKEAPKAPASKEASSPKASASKEASPPKAPASKEPGANEAGAGAGMVVLSTTSTQQLVQLKVKAEQQTLARVGQSAPVMLPGGDVVRGRIIDVGSVASSAGGEGEKEKGGGGEKGEAESATIPVTLALEHRLAHLDEAPVSVELVKSIRRNVLAVPATALTATAGGGYAIETLEGSRRVQLAVTSGMFADGYVQVEGPGVREGLTVIESQ
jgi:hypothetical protein